MKRFVLLFTLLSFLSATAQKPSAAFIIEGQFRKVQGRYVTISFEDKNSNKIEDTIRIDRNGKFYYATKIAGPQQGFMSSDEVGAFNIMMAPGYHLNIAGDAAL